MDQIPTQYDIIIWIACAFVVLITLQKSWATIRRWFGIGDAISGLPELTEQVGLMATTLEEFKGTLSEIEGQVANSHESNLRENIDANHEEVLDQLCMMNQSIAAANAVSAAALEKSNDNEKAVVRLWERIDSLHPPGSE